MSTESVKRESHLFIDLLFHWYSQAWKSDLRDSKKVWQTASTLLQ